MATRKKTNTEPEVVLAQDLINSIGDLYPVLDEIAGNSNYLKDIAEVLTRIAVALEKRNSDLKTK
jgi:hypothetical protein